LVKHGLDDMENPGAVKGGIAVLVSGGLDSTVLLADVVAQGYAAQAIHVRCGFAWEEAEARVLARILSAPPLVSRTPAPVTLTVDARDFYPSDHWARAGGPPPFNSPDADVYLEGRNVLLITHAALWCRRHGVTRLVLGSLAGNPFPDATPAFFAAMAMALSRGLDYAFDIRAPYLTLAKYEVAHRGRALGVPIELTLSCMNPGTADRPCGACSKCRERRQVCDL
jgi:7-cyano-7-deazaguanine synthase